MYDVPFITTVSLFKWVDEWERRGGCIKQDGRKNVQKQLKGGVNKFNQWRHAWERNNMKECIKQTNTQPFKLAF